VNKAAGLRPNDHTDIVNATKLALRSLARRVRSIDAQMAEIHAVLGPLAAVTAPDLMTLSGVGHRHPGALIVAAGDNPEASPARPPSSTSAACHHSMRRRASSSDTGSTGAGPPSQLRPFAHRGHDA
jgi:hypothetical protein